MRATQMESQPFSELLSHIVDNRGKTCPTCESGIALIATNCVKNENLYPVYEKVRYVSDETYKNWFRGHPEHGDLLFVTKGTPGQVCLVPSKVDFCIAQDMVSIRPNSKKVDPMFLFASLRSPDIQGEIDNLHVGTLIPHFKKSDFDKLLIPLPKRELQEYIGRFYFICSYKIDLLNRQNKTLEGLAATLWRKMFNEDADPNWKITTFSDHVGASRGLSYKGNGLTEINLGIPMHNLNSVYEGGGYKYEGIKYYTGNYQDKHVIKPGDIIVTNTEQGHEFRLIGFPAMVPHYFGEKGIFSQHIYKLNILKNSYLTSQFIYYLIMTPKVREQIIGATNGSTVNMLAIDGLQRPEFSLPPEEKVKQFSETVKLFWQKQAENKNEIRTLSTLRDSLLPKLMSGAVRVKANGGS